MLPLKKIYIDSRDRTPDSKSSSNFKIELPYTVQMPENTIFFVTDVCIPHVWTTVEEDKNDRLYLYYRTTSGHLPVQLATKSESWRVVTLTPRNYNLSTLATEIQTQLNDALDSNAKSFTSFIVTSDATSFSITISLSSTSNCYFKLYTDSEVRSSSINWIGGSVDPYNVKSANDVLKLVSPMDETTSITSGFVNLNQIHNVYLTSPNLGSFDTIASFSNNIIKKIPVTADYGQMILDQFISTNDFLDCSRQTLKTLEFHLRDGRGNEINLHGMYITFSLVFNKYNLEI